MVLVDTEAARVDLDPDHGAIVARSLQRRRRSGVERPLPGGGPAP